MPIMRANNRNKNTKKLKKERVNMGRRAEEDEAPRKKEEEEL